MPARPAQPVPQPSAPPLTPRLRALLLALCALLLLGLFSREVYDSDFWWHLRTGQYIVGKRALPFPDPFAWTTARAPDAYPGEALTRRFNLTHEWLAQVVFYAVWRTGGIPAIVAARAAGATEANSPDMYAAAEAISRAERLLQAQEYTRARLAALQAKSHAGAALVSVQHGDDGASRSATPGTATTGAMPLPPNQPR